MAKKATSPVLGKDLPTPINPDDVPSVYCNQMQLVVSGLDARLLFHEIVLGDGEPRVELRANVVMTIEHFRAMTQVMVERSQHLPPGKSKQDSGS